ncbi:MAG TPA: CRISPR-associated protein, partial [Clostridiaceae bacterium]|nr:CRISPR-associated protein [Clostridiaceae bacterium]
MKSRVYGVLGVSARMANWNADFTGRPKTTSNGDIYGSDKAFKYTVKRHWTNNGEKVLYIKSYKIETKGKKKEDMVEKLQPKELKERYEEIFEPNKIDKSTSSKEVLKNLFSAIDVMNFGATFPVDELNISITGAVQIGQGFNKYKEASVEIQDILSPFRNSGKDEATASSLGKKIMCDEAHYFYPFSVNPKNYNDYVGLVNGFDGYADEAYRKFKDGALVGATELNTNSKSGCENEFALFIELKDDAQIYLPNLDKYVEFYKENGKNVIDIRSLNEIIDEEVIKCIDNIEIYYNPFNTLLKQNLKDAKLF